MDGDDYSKVWMYGLPKWLNLFNKKGFRKRWGEVGAGKSEGCAFGD